MDLPPALPDPNLSVVNLRELARHPPQPGAVGGLTKRLQEAVLVQQARRDSNREAKVSEMETAHASAASTGRILGHGSRGNRHVPPSASVPSHMAARAISPSASFPTSDSLGANSANGVAASGRPTLPDPKLSVANLQELARHDISTTTTTQKRLNQKHQRKKTKTMREKYEGSERRASFLSRTLSWLWANRSYLFVAAGVAWLNSRDKMRAEMIRRARGLRQQERRRCDRQLHHRYFPRNLAVAKPDNRLKLNLREAT